MNRINTSASVLFFLLLLTLPAFAQFTPEPDPRRGLYMDYFFKTRLNSSSTVDPVFSILGVDMDRDGIFEKEDEILRYAAESHITYLALYDMGRILGQNLYAWNQNTRQMEKMEKHLCRFIAKAKKQYGITQIGAISSSVSGFDSIRTYMDRYPTTGPYRLRPEIKNSAYYDSSMAVVEKALQPGDKDYEFAEQLKFLLRAADFNSCEDCEADIDVINLEYEFWGTCPSDFANFRTRMFAMNNVRNFYNANHPYNPIKTETYLAFLTFCTSSMPVAELVGTMDGCTNCSPCATCANPHPRMVDRYLLAYQTSVANWWPVGEINMFELASSEDSTDMHPLLYSESKVLGGGVDFLGPWLIQSPYNTFYYVEEQFYDSWRNNTSTAWNTPRQNDVQPGGVQWFAQSYMVKPLKNPKLFSASSPVCSGSGAAIDFEYYGPVEHGYRFEFYISRNSDSSIVYPASGVPVRDTAGVYIPSGPGIQKIKPVNFRDTTLFPPCILLNGDYTAFLKLIFSDKPGLNYTSTLPIVVDSRPRIIVSGDTIFCEGGQTFLEGPSGAASYRWFRNGEVIAGANGRMLIVKERGYYHLETSGGTTCSGISDSISIQVKPLAPVYINSICNGNGTVTLRTNLLPVPVGAADAGHIYQWNNGATTPEITVTPSSSSVSYRVVVTNPYSGCSAFAKHSVPSSPSVAHSTSITVDAQPSGPCTQDGALTLNVNPNPGWSQMHVMWSNGERTPSISNLAPGTYTVAVFHWNTACTTYDSMSIGTLPSNPPTVNAVITPASCTRSSDGQINLSLSGGHPPFRYEWISFPADSVYNPYEKDQENLFPGIYQLEIRDSMGCTFSHRFLVDKTNNTPLITVTSTTAAGPCASSANGTAIVSASGGLAPYSYSWNDAAQQTTATANGLLADTYTVTVSDANSCTNSLLVSVPGINAPLEVHLLDSSRIQLDCSSSANGSLYACIHGGLPPFAVAAPWILDSNLVYMNNLSAGNFPLSVSDAAACVVSDSYPIMAAVPPQLFLQTQAANCIGCTDGKIFFQVIPGNPSYQISWSPALGQTDGDSIYNLPAGIYEVCVEDAAFCRTCISDTIFESSVSVPFIEEARKKFLVYPNPASGIIHVEFSDPAERSLEILNRMGQRVYFTKISSTRTSIHADLPAGIYWIHVHNVEERLVNRIVIMKE